MLFGARSYGDDECTVFGIPPRGNEDIDLKTDEVLPNDVYISIDVHRKSSDQFIKHTYATWVQKISKEVFSLFAYITILS